MALSASASRKHLTPLWDGENLRDHILWKHKKIQKFAILKLFFQEIKIAFKDTCIFIALP